MKKKIEIPMIIFVVVLIIFIILILNVDSLNKFLSESFSTVPEQKEIICYGDDKPCQVQKELNELVNEVRIQKNISSIIYDQKLSNIAYNHSKDMEQRNFIGHVNPGGLGVSDRGKEAGYECMKFHGASLEQGLAENIYQTSLYKKGIVLGGDKPFYTWFSVEELANNTINAWLSSEGHRKNLLSENYTKQGLGVVITNNNSVLITQVFC